MSTMTCPTCGTHFEADKTPAMPFCSIRCQQIDLQRWLNEEHRLPHIPREDDEEFESWPSQHEE